MRTLTDLQRAPGVPPPPAQLALPGAVTRTFDTPEFAGMTFLEVEAKSALNRVRGMPFPWSINPYRGCSHACSYCMSGDTPVLLANGRTKPIADMARGDEVVGTVVDGHIRRYTPTVVLDHWETRKEAYRVVLADGTELVASGDHRFLTVQWGWKHVTDAAHGEGQRPHLTTNNALLGTGKFAAPPEHDDEYRRGYLTGMIRGDGTIGHYSYGPDGKYRTHTFRLALTDAEGLARTELFLRAAGLVAREQAFATPAHRRPVRAIALSSEANVATLEQIIAIPAVPSTSWMKGFLAGIFDAAGSHIRGIFRISNTNEVLLSLITSGLRRFGFKFAEERVPGRATNIRIVGGLAERLRFFHTVDPAITRKRTITGMALKCTVDLRVVAIERLGITIPMYDITTGTGDFIANGVVSHNCFARPTHAYLNLSPLGDFERTIVVKTNVAEVLRAELRRRTWKREHVAMGTNTDPYQRCEGRYRLMPGIIGALAESATPFSILTKGTLIHRDLSLLVDAAKQVQVAAALTVGMLDEAVWRSSEPGTPSPVARLAAVKALNDAGVPTGVMLAPIMPGLNDDAEQLEALVDAAAAAGARHITPIVLHLRPGVREVFWPWLEHHHPELVERYTALYARGGNAAKDYRGEIETLVRGFRADAWRRHGRPETPPSWGAAPDTVDEPAVSSDAAAPTRSWRRTGRPPLPGAAGAAGEQLSLLTPGL